MITNASPLATHWKWLNVFEYISSVRVISSLVSTSTTDTVVVEPSTERSSEMKAILLPSGESEMLPTAGIPSGTDTQDGSPRSAGITATSPGIPDCRINIAEASDSY